MNSLISIGVILSGKENYHEWFRKVKYTLSFNDTWDGICENYRKARTRKLVP